MLDQAKPSGTKINSGRTKHLANKLSGISHGCDTKTGRGRCLKSRTEAALQGQSSEKSSQDRLSLQDKEECDGWTGDAPISSLHAAASASSDSLDQPLRHGSSTDPDWSPSNSTREEAISCSPPINAQTSLDQAAPSKAGRLTPCKATVEAACAEAALKKQRAVKLVVAAKSAAIEAFRATKRQKVPSKSSHKLYASSPSVLGSRVAIYWPNDKQSYKGKIINIKGDGLEHQVQYDDNWTEWLSLSDEKFQLICPRAKSAGCNSLLLDELKALAADGLCAEESYPVAKDDIRAGPQGEAALGWVVSVCCMADNQCHEGQLIAYKSETDQHHILYLDGEDEWLKLGQESMTWIRRLDRPSHAGLDPGHDSPADDASVGWQISVYWRHLASFMSASVISYDPVSRQHCVSYTDGDEEHLWLATQCIKWCQAPNSAQASSLIEAPLNATPERKWAFKTSKPRSSRIMSSNRQSSWANLDLEQKDGGTVDMKTEEEDSPVSGIFEYIGPPQNKLPLLSGRRPSPGYVGDAEKGTKSESEQDGASKMQLHSQADDTDVKTADQDICPDGSTPWRMGSPFEGLEFAPEVPIPGLHFPKTEVDPECTLSLQLEDKLLAMDRQATAPSPVPLLDNNHPVFTENLLVTTECCHPSLQSNLGSGNISSDSLDMSEDYLDMNVLVDMPTEAPAAEWYHLQPL